MYPWSGSSASNAEKISWRATSISHSAPTLVGQLIFKRNMALSGSRNVRRMSGGSFGKCHHPLSAQQLSRGLRRLPGQSYNSTLRKKMRLKPVPRLEGLAQLLDKDYQRIMKWRTLPMQVDKTLLSLEGFAKKEK